MGELKCEVGRIIDPQCGLKVFSYVVYRNLNLKSKSKSFYGGNIRSSLYIKVLRFLYRFSAMKSYNDKIYLPGSHQGNRTEVCPNLCLRKINKTLVPVTGSL